MTSPVVEIGIKTAIIDTETTIIGATAIAIDAEAIAVVTVGVIEIGGVITPLKDEKKRISIGIKGLKGIPA